MQTNNKMAVAPVGKLIWQMSIPPLISMFLQYSYNLIDSAFVARLSENALIAVSLAFPITTLMNAASIWIGVGVNVLIAGYLGQKKQDDANTTVTHGLLLAFGIGALLNLLALLIMKPYFRAFTNNEEIYQLSIAYMSVCSFMQIPNMVHIAIQKMIQATGNMVAPMCFQIAGVIVNFVFDPILIFGIGVFPDMGIRGAAEKAESAGKNQRLSFAKADDPPYFCLWPAIFYYERPQFVYSDVRQSVPGGVFRYGDCFLRRIL